MTRAAQEAHNREQESMDGESRFLQLRACRPLPLKERAAEVKLARKIHGKRRPKTSLERLFEIHAASSNILKANPTSFTIKETVKPIVTVGNSDIAKFGTLQERPIPLIVYAERRGPRMGKKLVEENIQSNQQQDESSKLLSNLHLPKRQI